MRESFGYAKAIEGDDNNIRVIMVNRGLPVAKPEQYDVNRSRFKQMKISTGVGIPLSTKRRELNKEQYEAVVDFLT